MDVRFEPKKLDDDLEESDDYGEEDIPEDEPDPKLPWWNRD